MTPRECCNIGATYGDTRERDLRSLKLAAQLHAEVPMNPAALESELRKLPEMVDGWLRWAEDKRWSPAWFFTADGDQFVVGYLSTDTLKCKSKVFEDRYQACAAFIIHELEDYRFLLEQRGE
jgi:hypothetical protein